MYCYVDESGNTGLELFDKDQPILYYGVLSATVNLDIVAEPFLRDMRKKLGVARLHANQLGVAKLTEIAEPLTRFSKKKDLRFSLLRVAKQDHALISFFDQVFDSGMNKAVPWHHYFTPLRYVLLFKVCRLFDEKLASDVWMARREKNPAKCADMLISVCETMLDRVKFLPDLRSREVVSGALKWAIANPFDIQFGVGNHDSELQISPNLIGFQQVLQTISEESGARRRPVKRIIVDQQTEFNKAQAELAGWYRNLRGIKAPFGSGMPACDYSHVPEVPPTFKSSTDSAGLELVDITLWVSKRTLEHKSVSAELEKLWWTQSRRGREDEVSLAGLDARWRHLFDPPEPENPVPAEIERMLAELEEQRRLAVETL